MYDEKETEAEQDHHQSLAIKIMKMKILNPQQTSSKIVAPGKNQPSISRIISETMNKAHQLAVTAPAIPTEYIRKLMKAEKVKSANIGLVRDIEMHLGRAVIYKDCEESNNLAQLGTLMANFKRSLHDKYRNRAKKEVAKEALDIVASIMPEENENWQTFTS